MVYSPCVTAWRIDIRRPNQTKLMNMENSHKETNLLCMNFRKVEHVSVGGTWKSYKNFPIDGVNASGVKKWPLPSVRSKCSNITAN